MEMVVQENNPPSTRQKYVNSIKTSFVTLGKRTILAALAAIPGAGPVFAWGPIPYLSGLAIDWGLTKIADGTDTGIYFLFVDFRVAHQSKDFTDAAMENYNAQMNGTKEEKNAAEKKLIEAFDTFVKLNNIG